MNRPVGLRALASSFSPASVARGSKLAHSLLVVLDETADEAALLALSIALAERFRLGEGDPRRRVFDLLVEIGWEAATGNAARSVEGRADAIIDRLNPDVLAGAIVEGQDGRFVVLGSNAMPSGDVYVLAPVGPGDVDTTKRVAIVREDLEEGRYRVLGSAPSGEVALAVRILVATLEGCDLHDVGAMVTPEGVDITINAAAIVGEPDADHLREILARWGGLGRLVVEDEDEEEAAELDDTEPPPEGYDVGSWWRARKSWGPDAGALAKVEGSLQGGRMLALRVYDEEGARQTAIARVAFDEHWEAIDEPPPALLARLTRGKR